MEEHPKLEMKKAEVGELLGHISYLEGLLRAQGIPFKGLEAKAMEEDTIREE